MTPSTDLLVRRDLSLKIIAIERIRTSEPLHILVDVADIASLCCQSVPRYVSMALRRA